MRQKPAKVCIKFFLLFDATTFNALPAFPMLEKRSKRRAWGTRGIVLDGSQQKLWVQLLTSL